MYLCGGYVHVIVGAFGGQKRASKVPWNWTKGCLGAVQCLRCGEST